MVKLSKLKYICKLDIRIRSLTNTKFQIDAINIVRLISKILRFTHTLLKNQLNVIRIDSG